MLFNTIVDNAVRNWISLTVEDKLVSHEVVGTCGGAVFGTVLRPQWHGGIAVSGVDPEHPQHAHWPLPKVWTDG